MRHSNIHKLASLTAALSLALGLGLGLASTASARAEPSADTAGSTVVKSGLQPVESIPMLTRPWSWQPVDNRTVILWATPFRPYLVELAFPVHDLRFAQILGVTSFGDRVYARFDAVRVRGFRYPIDHIYKMTSEEAKNWTQAK
jgi:Family of unknown function (DUF6491)